MSKLKLIFKVFKPFTVSSICSSCQSSFLACKNNLVCFVFFSYDCKYIKTYSRLSFFTRPFKEKSLSERCQNCIIGEVWKRSDGGGQKNQISQMFMSFPSSLLKHSMLDIMIWNYNSERNRDALATSYSGRQAKKRYKKNGTLSLFQEKTGNQHFLHDDWKRKNFKFSKF